jgi:limonene-1,2-epoxide hydrolase
MTTGLVPQQAQGTQLPSDPTTVVETFLAALAANDFATAGALLADDVVYTNVGLPTIRGRRGVIKALSPLARFGDCFEVYLHSVTTNATSVATERTDVLKFGPVRLQFWVWGRFDVTGGQITLWRDAYDYLDMTRALVRGLLGALVPALRPKPPASIATAPGRH